jgi:hypothetical protein
MKVFFKVSGIALLVLVLAGCGTAATPAPTPTASVTPATLICQANQLSISLGSESGAMGAVGVTGMAFKNLSATACTLMGYPKIQMLDAMGKSIPTFVTNVPNLMGLATSATLIAVNPGQSAIFNLMYEAGTGYGNSVCPTSNSVLFTPPGSTTALTLPWKIQPFGGATIATLHCGEIRTSPVYLP